MILNLFKQISERIPRKKLDRMFTKLAKEEMKPGWQGMVNLIFIGDGEMRKLNWQFRKTDKTTDVLAFNLDQPENKDSLFGEVYVSVPTAMKQARSFGVTPEEELLKLSCHGILHLFGYDHIKKRDAHQMSELEKYYVKYAREGRSD